MIAAFAGPLWLVMASKQLCLLSKSLQSILCVLHCTETLGTLHNEKLSTGLACCLSGSMGIQSTISGSSLVLGLGQALPKPALQLVAVREHAQHLCQLLQHLLQLQLGQQRQQNDS